MDLLAIALCLFVFFSLFISKLYGWNKKIQKKSSSSLRPSAEWKRTSRSMISSSFSYGIYNTKHICAIHDFLLSYVFQWAFLFFIFFSPNGSITVLYGVIGVSSSKNLNEKFPTNMTNSIVQYKLHIHNICLCIGMHNMNLCG